MLKATSSVSQNAPGISESTESSAKPVEGSLKPPGQAFFGRENGSKMLAFVKQHGIDKGLLGIADGEMLTSEEDKKLSTDDSQEKTYQEPVKKRDEQAQPPDSFLEKELQQTREELARLRRELEIMKQVLILMALLQKEKEEEKRKELMEVLIRITTLFLNGIITGKLKEYQEENESVPGGI